MPPNSSLDRGAKPIMFYVDKVFAVLAWIMFAYYTLQALDWIPTAMPGPWTVAMGYWFAGRYFWLFSNQCGKQ